MRKILFLLTILFGCLLFFNIPNALGATTRQVIGPSTATTPNAVVRWRDTSGFRATNSSVTIDDSGNVITSGTFIGNGSGLTNLTTLPTLAGNNVFTGSTNHMTGSLGVAGTFDVDTFTATTAAFDTLQLPFASALVGVDSSSNLVAATWAQVQALASGTIITNGHSAAITFSNNVTVRGDFSVALTNAPLTGTDANGKLVVTYNASGLTNLNASNLASGTLDNARLDTDLQAWAGISPTNAASAGNMLYASSATTARWDAAPTGSGGVGIASLDFGEDGATSLATLDFGEDN